MNKELFSLADRIRCLREDKGMTQAGLSKVFGITRSSINAWEMGLSVPSTQYIVELAKFFSVSTDFLLGLEKTSSINVDGLTQKEIVVITNLIECLKNKGIQQNDF